jgi:hypothetical protein
VVRARKRGRTSLDIFMFWDTDHGEGVCAVVGNLDRGTGRVDARELDA